MITQYSIIITLLHMFSPLPPPSPPHPSHPTPPHPNPPQSRFYHDPVLVLDFQSLYPSLIIAFNLCFSTCMGQMRPYAHTGPTGPQTNGRLGPFDYPERQSAAGLAAHPTDPAHQPHLTPNGTLFCSPAVREGVLPQMLREILNTRLMVKREMKGCTGSADDVLRRVLDCRQLAIKMLSNVTYGYAAASFSGRMPMAELADAIVQQGRSLLEWVMREIEQRWAGAEGAYFEVCAWTSL